PATYARPGQFGLILKPTCRSWIGLALKPVASRTGERHVASVGADRSAEFKCLSVTDPAPRSHRDSIGSASRTIVDILIPSGSAYVRDELGVRGTFVRDVAPTSADRRELAVSNTARRRYRHELHRMGVHIPRDD